MSLFGRSYAVSRAFAFGKRWEEEVEDLYALSPPANKSPSQTHKDACFMVAVIEAWSQDRRLATAPLHETDSRRL